MHIDSLIQWQWGRGEGVHGQGESSAVLGACRHIPQSAVPSSSGQRSGGCDRAGGFVQRRCYALPLPGGEGWGEGECLWECPISTGSIRCFRMTLTKRFRVAVALALLLLSCVSRAQPTGS